jgi:DNA-binding transcriptional ArsR family regulator
MYQLSDAALEQVAAYFRALGEPKRLEILQWLDQRPYNVGELAERCACSAANISRHLALLTRYGLVQREMRGHCAYYQLADPALDTLCEHVYQHLARSGAAAQGAR